MVSLLAALSLAVLPRVAEEAPSGSQALVSLGMYRIGSRDVEAKVPGAPGPFGPETMRVEHGGARYLVGSGGKLVRRLIAQGGWSEWRALSEAARKRIGSSTPVWKVKVIVLSRVDLLDRTPSSSLLGTDASGTLLSVRRHSMDASELDHVYESLARFAAFVEAESGGALRTTVDVEVDGDWARLDSDTVADPESLGTWFRERVYPRVNGGAFEPEDRVYRGPYDSIFCVHAGMFEDPPTFEVLGMPVSAVGLSLKGLGRSPYGFSFSLLEAWRGHLLRALREHGFGVESSAFAAPEALPEELKDGFEPPSAIARCFGETNWGRVSNSREATTPEFAANGVRAAPKEWSQVLVEGIWKLPDLEKDLRGKLGGVEVGFTARGRSLTFGEDSIPADRRTLDLGRESWAEFTAGGARFVVADPEYATLVAQSLSDDRGLPAVAKVEGAFGIAVIFDASGLGPAQTESASLGSAKRVGTQQRTPPAAWDGSEISFDQARVADLHCEGTYTAAYVLDPERGHSVEIKPGEFPRRGQVWLVGGARGPAIFDAASTPFLSFWIKAERSEPLEVRVASASDRWAGASWAIFGSPHPPAEMGSLPNLPLLDVAQDGTWQKVVLDLRTASTQTGPLPVSGIAIGSSRYTGYRAPSLTGGSIALRIGGLFASSEARGSVTGIVAPSRPTPSPTGASPLERALFAAQVPVAADATAIAALTALLKDPSDFVELNAAAAFRRVKSAAAVPALADAVSSLDSRVSEQAVFALAAQDTEAAWAVLRRSLEIGPFDYCREFAARAFRSRPDPKLLGSMTVLFTSRSWSARAEGAAALAAMGTPEAERAMLIFLYEVEPSVRLAAVRAANPASSDVSRRLLWHAVNDSSDAVRTACYLALLRSSNEELRAEGSKGVRDDSVAVRLEILRSLAEAPSEAARGALRLAVTDTSPRVRAAALRAFARLPGPVAPEEVANVADDIDPRVRAAYEALVRAKGLRPPLP